MAIDIEELTNKAYGSTPTASQQDIKETLAFLEQEGMLKPKPEPIAAADVRKGDRIRVEYMFFGEPRAHEYTVNLDGRPNTDDGEKLFLIERPKPQLPEENGAKIVLRFGSESIERDAVLADGTWHVATKDAGLVEYTPEQILGYFKIVE